MIRSQSLSNLNEQKKFKGGLLSSWKSRKPSKNEAKIDTIPENGLSNNGKPISKRLSQSVSTQSLGMKAKESAERNNSDGKRYSQYPGREEYNKENIRHPSEITKVRAPGIRVSEPRTLNALEGSNQFRSKRNSTVLGPSTSPSDNKLIDYLRENSSLDKYKMNGSHRRDVSPLKYKDTNSLIQRFELDDAVHYKPGSNRFPTQQQLLDLTKVINTPESYTSNNTPFVKSDRSHENVSKELQNINECLQASLEKRHTSFVASSKCVGNVLFLSFEDPKLQRNSLGHSLADFSYDSELEDPSQKVFFDDFY